jgi:hypothetical protein
MRRAKAKMIPLELVVIALTIKKPLKFSEIEKCDYFYFSYCFGYIWNF